MSATITAPVAVVLSAEIGVNDQIGYWLSSTGHRTAAARSGYAARRLIVAGETRLLITDRVLPPWPGLDTIVSLKQTFAGLMVAFLGDGVADTRQLALSAGADLILPRPLRRADVLQAMHMAGPARRRLECAS